MYDDNKDFVLVLWNLSECVTWQKKTWPVFLFMVDAHLHKIRNLTTLLKTLHMDNQKEWRYDKNESKSTHIISMEWFHKSYSESENNTFHLFSFLSAMRLNRIFLIFHPMKHFFDDDEAIWPKSITSKLSLWTANVWSRLTMWRWEHNEIENLLEFHFHIQKFHCHQTMKCLCRRKIISRLYMSQQGTGNKKGSIIFNDVTMETFLLN